MTRTGNGWCPFADQIEGVTSFKEGGDFRVGFCDHTAGGFYSTLTNPGFWNDAGVSVHFAIARDGRIAQIINIFDTAYAQGLENPPNSWPPYDQMGRKNPNGYLISTEHEDHIMVNGNSQAVPGSEWTPEQYAADLKVKRWCIEEVQRVHGNSLMKFGKDSLAGHHMFDPVNRAECPGRFWRDIYHDKLWKDISMPEVWVYGDKQNGLELRQNQQVFWIGGIEVFAIGDPEGEGLGRIAKKFGDNWLWLRNDNGNAIWSQEEGD